MSENAEWDDAAHTVLRIMWKTPEALALDVYEWASKREILGTVYTFYELLSGDEYTDSGSAVCEKYRVCINESLSLSRLPWL